MAELEQACVLFTKASRYSIRAQKALVDFSLSFSDPLSNARLLAYTHQA